MWCIHIFVKISWNIFLTRLWVSSPYFLRTQLRIGSLGAQAAASKGLHYPANTYTASQVSVIYICCLLGKITIISGIIIGGIIMFEESIRKGKNFVIHLNRIWYSQKDLLIIIYHLHAGLYSGGKSFHEVSPPINNGHRFRQPWRLPGILDM